MSEFAGKTVVITGGASGVGAATARRFVEARARVLIADFDRQAGLTCVAALGGGSDFQFLDVQSETSWHALARRIAEERGRIDVLVNCAAIIAARNIEDCDLDTWQRIIGVNLTGTFLGCRAAIPLMKERGGVIVNFASSIVRRAQAEQLAYGASKAGVEHLTRSIALHCGKQGYPIRVVCVQPGALDSTMLKSNTPAGMTEGAFLQYVTTRHPIGRLGTYDDIAKTVMFVASDQASFMTGTMIAVDGGTSIA